MKQIAKKVERVSSAVSRVEKNINHNSQWVLRADKGKIPPEGKGELIYSYKDVKKYLKAGDMVTIEE